MDLGVAVVVELAASEPMASLPRDLVRLRFPLTDGSGNPSWLLRLAVASVGSLILERVPTLVCCSAGMSRSVGVTAAGLARAADRSFLESLKEVIGDGPADLSPALAVALREILGDQARLEEACDGRGDSDGSAGADGARRG
jgi:hypothetical protein